MVSYEEMMCRNLYLKELTVDYEQKIRRGEIDPKTQSLRMFLNLSPQAYLEYLNNEEL